MDGFNLTLDLTPKQLYQFVSEIKQKQIRVSSTLKASPYHKNIWFEHSSRRYLYHLHSLKMIHYLLDYYEKTKDDSTLEEALNLFYSWYENNYPKSQCDLSYQPAVIATRLMTVCQLLTICKNLKFCLLDDVFFTVILTHIKYLSLDYKYKQFHFDGIKQDIALFMGSYVYGVYFIKDAFLHLLKKAQMRLVKQLDYFIINEDNSFISSSIQKAYLLFIELHLFQLYLERLYEFRDFSLFLKSKTDILYTYLFHFVEWGGVLLPIGESSSIRINLELMVAYDHPYRFYYQFIMTGGKEGLPYPDALTYFKKRHVFIYQNKDIKLISDNGLKTVQDKHHDKLAFLLSYQGIPIFIDGGKYNYQESNYYRKSLLSSYAHNTICVDCIDYHIEKINLEKTGITNIIAGDKVFFACLNHLLYRDVYIKRNFLMIDHQLYIIDELNAKNSHQYELIFHLNPCLNLLSKQNKTVGYLNQQEVLEFKTIFSTLPLEKRYHHGNKQPYMGFRSIHLNQIEPSHVFIYQGSGKTELIITQISLGEPIKSTEVIANDHYILLHIGNASYRLNRGIYTNSISISTKEINNNIIPNLYLNKEVKAFFKLK